MPILFTRVLRWTRPAMRGADVEAVQRALLELGYTVVGTPDGIFGGNTEAAVRAFQSGRGLSVDGVVGEGTWQLLMPDAGAEPLDSLATLIAPHGFRDGITWRLTPRGIELDGVVAGSAGRLVTVPRIWRAYETEILRETARYAVPAELILATICTESRGNRFAVREEPGYVSDEETPNLVSPGLMQTLIATARGTLARDPDIAVEDIDRDWLFDAGNSIRAGTAYIARQRGITQLDPPKVACAYNAGGVYYNGGAGNRWKMRQYPIGSGEHADRFVMWFNDGFRMFAEGLAQPPAGGYYARLNAG